MPIYTDIYEAYNKPLLEELGLDWFILSQQGQSGIYPDTCRLLVELVKRPEVHSVLELGSGLSTVYLAGICQKLSKSFTSVEESPDWLSKTKMLLISSKMNDSCLVLAEDYDYSQIKAPDLIFLDSQDQTRDTLLSKIKNKSWSPTNTIFIIVDDVENPKYLVPLQKWFAKSKRYNTSIIDLVGREDRHQLVNCSDPIFNLSKWIWSWRPDRKYW